jgi:site-specific DNA-methyltransferase (adenine-specific)
MREELLLQTDERTEIVNPYLNQFHCGDSLGIMRSMPKKSVSVVVTSPPYNLKNSTGNGMKDGRGGKWSNAELINGYESHSDDLPYHEYVEWQRNCLEAMMELLTDDGVIFYNHKWRVQGGLLQDRQEIVSGFPVRQIIIWRRKGGINFNQGYFLPTYEVIYMITKPKFKLAPKANSMTDIWEITQERDNTHPAPFPVELPYRCISATRGGVVLDPFMGSGTTAIAAKKLKRDWIGIDVSEEYCNMAKKRISLYDNKLI